MSEVLRSALLDGLGVQHGFGPCRSRPGAEPDAEPGADAGADPGADRRRFVGSAGLDGRVVYEVSQVHGAAVRRVRPSDDLASVRATEADALVASGGAAIAVRVADCVAVLVADPERGDVAAVHAGWRGAVRGVLDAAIAELARDGGRPAGFAASLFPHIRACCFEVGDDVAMELARAAGRDDVVLGGRAKPHVDLARVVRARLEAAGMRADRIDDVAGCTRCEPERFHSYRRDGADAGRHFAAIASR